MGTLVLGKFSNGRWYPGTVTAPGFDADTKTYHIRFEDGDDLPNFRAADVKQDLVKGGQAIRAAPEGGGTC